MQGTCGYGLVHVASASVPPGAVAVRGRGPGPLGVQASSDHFAGSPARTLPLPPQNGPQLAANPRIEPLAIGPGSERFHGFIQNTEVFYNYLDFGQIDYRNPELPIQAVVMNEPGTVENVGEYLETAVV